MSNHELSNCPIKIFASTSFAFKRNSMFFTLCKLQLITEAGSTEVVDIFHQGVEEAL